MEKPASVNLHMNEPLKKPETAAAAAPFYSESKIRYLKDRPDALNAGTLPLKEHRLIEVD